MPSSITLGYWPATLDNLCWSKDDMIAVGGSEAVTILAPDFKRSGQWNDVNLATSVYSKEEAPLIDPLPWSTFSVSEELSERHVSALQWSLPGLAKHGRSALAVLTSNHVLSIWECQGRPDAREDWTRVLVLNHILKELFANPEHQQQAKTALPPAEYSTRAVRIRSFCWSADGAGFPENSSILALSNESGDVAIVQITSPYNLFSSNQAAWQASVMHAFRGCPLYQEISPLLACLPSTYKAKSSFIDQLACSPWVDDGYQGQRAVLAFVCQGQLFCSRLRSRYNATGAHIESSIPETPFQGRQEAAIAGPIRWVPEPNPHAEEHSLVVFLKGAVLCMSFNEYTLQASQVTRHTIENQFDEVSGLTLGKDESGSRTLTYTLHISSTQIESAVLRIPFDQDFYIPRPSWQRDMTDAQSLHSAAHDLAGNVCTKTHGIASSPRGDFIATSTSLHPSDGLEYIILADQTCFLTLSREADTAADNILITKGSPVMHSDICSEIVLLCLQRFRDINPEAEFDPETVSTQLLRAVSVNSAEAPSSFDQSVTGSPQRLVTQLKHAILDKDDMVKQRYKRLVVMAKGESGKGLIPDLIIIRTLVTEVLRLPESLCENSDLSKTIHHIFSVVLANLDERSGVATSVQTAISGTEERCAICNEILAFESLRWARCSKGHQFQRCSLTFLAIRSPGKAKSCTICNAQYLNERLIETFIPPSLADPVEAENMIPEEDGKRLVMVKQGTVRTEPLASLARILFAACDVCIQCGGKFAG